MRTIVRAARRLGIGALTLFAFSEQNWGRPEPEVASLMVLLRDYLLSERDEMLNNGICLRAVGNLRRLPDSVRDILEPLRAETARQSGMVLTLALSYGGREEIVDAAMALCTAVQRGDVAPECVTRDTFARYIPSVAASATPTCLFVRGAKCAFRTFCFGVLPTLSFTSRKLWPEFGADDLHEAIATYQDRERRFGLTRIRSAPGATPEPALGHPRLRRSANRNEESLSLGSSWRPSPFRSFLACCTTCRGGRSATSASAARCRRCALEFFQLTHPGDRTAQAFGLVVSLGLFAALVGTNFGTNRPGIAIAALVAVAPAALVFTLFHPGDQTTSLARMAALALGPMYTATSIAAIACLRRMHAPGSDRVGAGLVVLALMIAWLGDTGGYFVGRGIGGAKLYPAVSPNKTWSGAVGGLGGSAIGALLAHFWFLPELPLAHGLVVALVAGAFGQAGDLCESLMKRSAGVKDSGGILPGHGGILDRLDAMMFVALGLYAALRSGWLVVA